MKQSSKFLLLNPLKNNDFRISWIIVLLLIKTQLSDASFYLKTSDGVDIVDNGVMINTNYRSGISATLLSAGANPYQFVWASETSSNVPYVLTSNYNSTLINLAYSVPNSGSITPTETPLTLTFTCSTTSTSTIPIEFYIIANGNQVTRLYFNFQCTVPSCFPVGSAGATVCPLPRSVCNNITGKCDCLPGWTSGANCGCTNNTSCNFPQGTCVSGRCQCNSSFGGVDCGWGFSAPETVCATQNYNFTWDIPSYEYIGNRGDLIVLNGPETGNPYDMVNEPTWTEKSCYSNRWFIFPFDSFWDKKTFNVKTVNTSIGSYNYTETEPGLYYYVMLKDNSCAIQLVKTITVLPNTDPQCAPLVQPPQPAGQCLNNCSGHGTCVNVSGTWGCACDYPNWYGIDCANGCSGESKLITDYSGIITDGSGPYRYNALITCNWQVKPNFTISGVSISVNQVWTYGDTVLLTWVDYRDGSIKSQSFDGSPTYYSCNEATLYTNDHFNITFVTNDLYIGYGWNITYKSNGCPPGKYVTNGLCEWCPQYYYSLFEDSDACLPCKNGTYNTYMDTAQCYNCPANYYNQEPGPCILCPNNTKTALEGASSRALCLCAEGYYSINGIAGNECYECPEGATCAGGTNAPVAKEKYWNSNDNPYLFLKCSSITACPGGANQTCGVGFDGEICSQCAAGYYMRLGNCYECSGDSSAWLPIGCVMLIVLCAVIYKATNRKDFLRINTLLSITTAFSLLITFLQIVVVYQDFKIEWPPFVQDFFSILSILNFNIDLAAPECSISTITDYTRYILKIFLPLLLPLAFAILHGLNWLQCKFAERFGPGFKLKFYNLCKVPDEKAKKFAPSRLRHWFSELFTLPQPMNINFTINSLVMLFDLIYIFICQVTFDIFNCYAQTDGTHSLFSNPQTRCYEGSWYHYLPFTILSIIIYILFFPALLIYIIYFAPSKQDNKTFMQRFNTIFYRFQPSKYWWELVVIARKLFITFVILIVSSNPVIQTTLAIAFIVTALFMHIYHWPYWVNECNWLETILLTVNLGILCIALLFIGENPKSNFGYNQTLFDFFSGLVLAFLVIGFGATILVTGWALFRFCFPVKQKIVSSEQEAVVGIWKNLTAQNSKADFDAVWKHLPREEQEMAILTAEAFGYEALGQKGTKMRRVSPTRLHYEERLRRKQVLPTTGEDSDYNEEDLIQLPELEKVEIKVTDDINSRTPLTPSDSNNIPDSSPTTEEQSAPSPTSPRRGRSTTRKDHSGKKKSKSGSRKDYKEDKDKSEKRDSKKKDSQTKKKDRKDKLKESSGAGNSNNNTNSSFNTTIDSKKTDDTQYTFGHYQTEKDSNENGNSPEIVHSESEREPNIDLEKEVSSANMKNYNNNNQDSSNNNDTQTTEMKKIVGVESGASGPIKHAPKKKKERNTKPLKRRERKKPEPSSSESAKSSESEGSSSESD